MFFLKKHTHSRIPCPFSLFFFFSVTPRVRKCPKIIMRSATSSSSFFMPSFSFLLLFLANMSVALFLHKRRDACTWKRDFDLLLILTLSPRGGDLQKSGRKLAILFAFKKISIEYEENPWCIKFSVHFVYIDIIQVFQSSVEFPASPAGSYF